MLAAGFACWLNEHPLLVLFTCALLLCYDSCLYIRDMSSQPNNSLATGLAVLTEICAANEALGGRELARRMGLHHAKVNRLLMTLAEIGVCSGKTSSGDTYLLQGCMY